MDVALQLQLGIPANKEGIDLTLCTKLREK